MARTPFLFEPLSLGGIALASRIAVSPHSPRHPLSVAQLPLPDRRDHA